MIKNIPKTAVWKKSFPVYKQFTVSNSDYEVISGSLETGSFETGSFNKQGNVYTHPLIKSIIHKYYGDHSNPFTMYGVVSDIGNFRNERQTGSNAYVISIDQEKYGEGIKKNSLLLTDHGNTIVYSDDGSGNIVSQYPNYTINSIDFQTGDITITDTDNEIFTGSIANFDVESGVAILTFGIDTDSVDVMVLDFSENRLQTSVALDFDELEIDEARYGNVFYADGTVILWDNPITNYTAQYRSTKTIHETEVLVQVKAGEFNFSQNPSAVDVTLFKTPYEFDISQPSIHRRAHKRKIKEILDISRKEEYYGTVGTSTGSWDDYDKYRQTDPTGSYLAPFITTIALYDDDGDMVAVAKLPTPIKNLPDMDMNFIVRFDT
jgi:hypothetical protein